MALPRGTLALYGSFFLIGLHFFWPVYGALWPSAYLEKFELEPLSHYLTLWLAVAGSLLIYAHFLKPQSRGGPFSAALFLVLLISSHPWQELMAEPNRLLLLPLLLGLLLWALRRERTAGHPALRGVAMFIALAVFYMLGRLLFHFADAKLSWPQAKAKLFAMTDKAQLATWWQNLDLRAFYSSPAIWFCGGLILLGVALHFRGGSAQSENHKASKIFPWSWASFLLVAAVVLYLVPESRALSLMLLLIYFVRLSQSAAYTLQRLSWFRESWTANWVSAWAMFSLSLLALGFFAYLDRSRLVLGDVTKAPARERIQARELSKLCELARQQTGWKFSHFQRRVMAIGVDEAQGFHGICAFAFDEPVREENLTLKKAAGFFLIPADQANANLLDLMNWLLGSGLPGEIVADLNKGRLILGTAIIADRFSLLPYEIASDNGEGGLTAFGNLGRPFREVAMPDQKGVERKRISGAPPGMETVKDLGWIALDRGLLFFMSFCEGGLSPHCTLQIGLEKMDSGGTRLTLEGAPFSQRSALLRPDLALQLQDLRVELSCGGQIVRSPSVSQLGQAEAETHRSNYLTTPVTWEYPKLCDSELQFAVRFQGGRSYRQGRRSPLVGFSVTGPR